MTDAIIPAEMVIEPHSDALIPAPDHDVTIIQMWLHDRSPHTQEAYRRDVLRLLQFTGKPIAHTTLQDLQAYSSTLDHLAPASKKRAISSVKSLFSFAQRLGYVPFNVGAAMRLPKPKNTIGERILSEAEVQRMIAREDNPRNRAIVMVLYYAGLRVTELCRLCWRDVQPREKAGQLAVFGKGDKTRYVLIPAEIFLTIISLPRGDQAAPVFLSEKAGPIGRVQVFRIVQAAAERAGIVGKVSPHWLRHAHATHALERGAPIHLVQATLGHSSVAITGTYLHARPTESSARFLPH